MTLGCKPVCAKRVHGGRRAGHSPGRRIDARPVNLRVESNRPEAGFGDLPARQNAPASQILTLAGSAQQWLAARRLRNVSSRVGFRD